jgi:copper(I)-binding protein
MRQRQRLVAMGIVVGFLLAESVLAVTARAQAPTITASNAWARRAAAMGSMGKMGSMDKMGSDKGSMGQMGGGGNGAVYVTLTNSGAQADSLVSASSEVAQTVELHEVRNDGGVMKMRPVKNIPVPAGGKVELKPGGYHIMLLKAGEKVAVTLKFQHGGEVQVEAAVR